jgi:hypothetical protein
MRLGDTSRHYAERAIDVWESLSDARRLILTILSTSGPQSTTLLDPDVIVLHDLMCLRYIYREGTTEIKAIAVTAHGLDVFRYGTGELKHSST